MAGETILTVVGNLTADPELRFTPDGSAVCNFNVASTPRTFDRKANEWRDGDTTFFRCNVWREAAEHAAESLTKGMRVVVTGRFKTRTWEKEGQQRTSVEIDVDEVGPSLRYATAKVTRTQRAEQPQQQARQGDPWSSQQQAGAQHARSEWGAPQSSGGWGAPGPSEPPF